MRILVTGAAGFIGSEFLNQLVSKGDYEITVVDSLTYAGRVKNLENVMDNISFYQVDIRNRSDLESLFGKSQFEKVVHFAAESHVDNSIESPGVFLETNVFGTQNLVEMAIKHEVSEFLHVSTDEVYGSITEGLAKEEDSFNPASAYAASKAAAEHFVNAARHTFKLKTKIVRCSNNYGPRQYPEKLIPHFIGKLMNGQNVPIYGTGENIREWLHVSDCASAIRLVLEESGPNYVYNVSSGQFYTNLEVTRLILAYLGMSDERIDYVEDRKGHDFRYAIDHKRIANDLGWKPLVDFNTGLYNTIEWYLSNKWALEKEMRG